MHAYTQVRTHTLMPKVLSHSTACRAHGTSAANYVAVGQACVINAILLLEYLAVLGMTQELRQAERRMVPERMDAVKS